MEVRMAFGRVASNGGGAAKENFDALCSELDTLLKDFGIFVSTLKDNASDRAGPELDAIRQRIAMLSNDLQTSGKQQLRNFEDQVGQRPYVSLAVALATGLIVGWLLDRR
jgi:ElaB/YqjD/DUF883 family membrane-anchored ribosome-binding protein